MPSRYLLESSDRYGYLLEDGSGVLIKDLTDLPYVVNDLQSFSLSGGPHTEVSASITILQGDLIIAYVKYESGSSKTVTLDDTLGTNDTWTEIESGHHDGTLSAGVRCFYLPNAAVGVSTIRATFSAGVDRPAIFVMSISNMALAPFDDVVYQSQIDPGTGANAVTSSNLGVLTTQPQMILGISHQFAVSLRSAPRSGTGFTDLGSYFDYEGTELSLAKVEHKRVTSTAATAATFTATNADHDFISVAMAFKEFVTLEAPLPPHMAPPIVSGLRW